MVKCIFPISLALSKIKQSDWSMLFIEKGLHINKFYFVFEQLFLYTK